MTISKETTSHQRPLISELGHELTPDEIRQISNHGVVVVETREVHQQTRTHSGRNSQTQIDLDADDLAAAIVKDCRQLSACLRNQGYSQQRIDDIVNRVGSANVDNGTISAADLARAIRNTED